MMLPTFSWTWIRSKKIYVTVQNPCTKSRAGSTPLCKIVTHDNQLSLKSNESIRLYFENVNGLSTSKNGCESDKVKKLRYLWSKLEVDFISLTETQKILHCFLVRIRFMLLCFSINQLRLY